MFVTNSHDFPEPNSKNIELDSFFNVVPVCCHVLLSTSSFFLAPFLNQHFFSFNINTSAVLKCNWFIYTLCRHVKRTLRLKIKFFSNSYNFLRDYNRLNRLWFDIL